jgi:hypothetical protein
MVTKAKGVGRAAKVVDPEVAQFRAGFDAGGELVSPAVEGGRISAAELGLMPNAMAGAVARQSRFIAGIPGADTQGLFRLKTSDSQ